MSYEELSLKGFINEMRDVSRGPHPRKFCFVLGAGASRTSGIKSGQELVNVWEKELLERNEETHLKWKAELGINDTNKYSFYSQYYERRFRRNPADGYNYLEKIMECAKPSIGYVMLSYLLTETDHNVVVTTNFDHLVEDAVNYYTQTIPLVIGHETLTHYISSQMNRPTIVKIHRDLLFDPKNTTVELETLHDNWGKALGIIFSEYHPVFIGYAGNDKSLMNFLIDNSKNFLDGKWKFPYWMIYKTDEVGGAVLDFLQETEGYLIRHEGFDEVMYRLGAAFDYKLPEKEEFLSDAEKRFQMLSNAVDDFTEKAMVKDEKIQEEQGIDGEDGDISEIAQAVQQITGRTELQRLYRKGVMLNNSGKYEEALKIKEQLVAAECKNPLYYHSYGVTLHELGRYEEAEESKKKAVELEPENARYHDSLGTTLHALGRYEEAEESKKRAVELEPENARYHDSLGITLHELGRYEEAEESKKKAVELEPQNARYHDSLGITLQWMNRYEEAEQETRKALELEPENARCHDSLGVTLHELGRYEEAEEVKRKAVELEPESAKYHDSLGVTLHELGRYEEAEKAERKAVELEPGNARYHNTFGVTLHELGRYEEAEQETRKALELEPGNARYHDSLGVTLHELGRYEEAEEAKKKAVELEPENARYHRSLGVTLHKLGRYEEAEEAKKKAVELESRDV